MSLADPFKKVLLSQKELLTDLEKQINQLESNELVAENQKLLTELENIRDTLSKELLQRQMLTTENKELKNALYEQIYNEKNALLRAVNDRSSLYFQSKTNPELNLLKSFEKKARKQIDEMTTALKNHRIADEEEIYQQLEDLKTKINQKITAAQAEFASSSDVFSTNQKKKLEELRKEQVTEYELNGVLKKNNLESLIGLNILSKIGILFLVIAVIALSRYGYLKLTNELKGIVIFLIGAVLLAAGEWLNRKRTNVFSIALTSGGISILYVATSLSYLTLQIISIEIALLLCVLVTLLAFTLSVRYSAQTIAVFAMIGGYLPVVTLTSPDMPPVVMMGYFIILNLLMLLIATKKRWTVSTSVGFVLNVGATLFILQNRIAGRELIQPFGLEDLYVLLYMLFAFLIYTLIPMVSVYTKKSKFQWSDVVIIGLNTFISALLMHVAFSYFQLDAFLGTLALVFAIAYLLLGWWMERYMPNEKLMNKLFYLTGFAFVILFVPFQFGSAWLTLGWLIEGVLLAIYGILQEEKVVKIAGIFICTLCLISFLFNDIALYLINHLSLDPLFTMKYFSVTLGSILILTALATKKTLQGGWTKVFQYASVINFWVFLLYMINWEWQYYIYQFSIHFSRNFHFNAYYLTISVSIVVTFLIAYFMNRIKALLDTKMKIISIILHMIGIFSLFILNMFYSPVHFLEPKLPIGFAITGTGILVLVSLLSILAVREILLVFVLHKNIGIEWYPMLISTYFVIILTQNLLTQFGLEFHNLVISLIYIVTALIWILYGFQKRNSFIRKFGLGLSILATGKLVFLDLANLTQFYKIVSYFAFGIFLLVISLVYQHFNKRLELHTEVIPNEKKDLD